MSRPTDSGFASGGPWSPGGGPTGRPCPCAPALRLPRTAPPRGRAERRPARPAPGHTDVAPAAGKIEFLGALRLLGAFRELLPRRENLQQNGQNDQGPREQGEGVEEALDPPH